MRNPIECLIRKSSHYGYQVILINVPTRRFKISCISSVIIVNYGFSHTKPQGQIFPNVGENDVERIMKIMKIAKKIFINYFIFLFRDKSL